MASLPRAWMFTAGLAAAAVVAALFAPAASVDDTSEAAVDSCVRYGRFECCVRPEE